MKLSNLRPATKPFLDTPDLKIWCLDKDGDGAVTHFKTNWNGVIKEFACNGKPDEAWKKMEKYFGDKL